MKGRDFSGCKALGSRVMDLKAESLRHWRWGVGIWGCPKP